MTTRVEIDESRMQAFGQMMLNDVASMYLGSLAYLGDRLRLFGAMADRGPVTAQELAEASGCHPRYIREWLSAMAAAGWVEYDSETELFRLPPEHAPFLAQEDHAMYMGGALEGVVAYAHMAPRLEGHFRDGGGIPYDEHHPDVPRIIDRFTAPLFRNFLTSVWLRELLGDVHAKLTEGGEAADVGCGSGRALVEMARAYPRSRFTGFEPNAPSVRRARSLAEREGVADRVEIVEAGSDAMPAARYDLVTTFDVIHDLVDPEAVIGDIRRATKPDGTYLMMEINASERLEENLHPLGKFFYSASTLYCMTVSLAHGGAGIGTCMGEERPRAMCARAGFSRFRRLDFEHPFAVLYEIRV